MSEKQRRKSGGKRIAGIFASSSTEQPLVTVITANFNSAVSLAARIESVRTQSYPNVEHLVMDGGSTDGSIEILCRYEDSLALWRSEPDNSPADAWNRGLQEARGEWICF